MISLNLDSISYEWERKYAVDDAKFYTSVSPEVFDAIL